MIAQWVEQLNEFVRSKVGSAGVVGRATVSDEGPGDLERDWLGWDGWVNPVPAADRS